MDLMRLNRLMKVQFHPLRLEKVIHIRQLSSLLVADPRHILLRRKHVQLSIIVHFSH